MDIENKTRRLEYLSNQVKNCEKCGLCKTAIQAVPGAGNPNSEIVFIGEAPGKNEDEQGIPFVGRAGKLLDFMLKQIGYERDDVWVGNIIKHRPPSNRDPSEEELNACSPYLTEQLKILQPKLIVTLGRFSMNYFLPNAKISTSRGKIERIDDKVIYPVYHPAAGLRNPTMKSALLKDFLNIPNALKEAKNEITDIIEYDNNSDPDEQIGLL